MAHSTQHGYLRRQVTANLRAMALARQARARDPRPVHRATYRQAFEEARTRVRLWRRFLDRYVQDTGIGL